MASKRELKIDEDEEYNMNNASLAGMESTFKVEGGIGINAEGVRDVKSGERFGRQICPDDLKVQGIIGRGACSSVQRCRHLRTNEVFALKRFNVYDREKRQQLVQEINTLYQVECPSLIGFYGAYQKKGNIYVILENMDRGSLNDLVYDYEGMPEKVLAAITYQILWGLAYLHYENRLHRDIKPSNILVNSSGEIKLTDFGIAKELDDSAMAKTIVGTFRYMSPVRLRGDPYGPPSDIWSLGIMLIECANRSLPFPNSNTQIELAQALEELVVDDMLPGHISEDLAEVVRSCLTPSPEKRITAEALLECSWMQNNEVADLDSAIDIVCQWLEDNPAQEGSCPSALGASKMISTLHSECSDSEEYDSDDAKAEPK
mmetsp:Transcript_35802/g.47267  ORF Transcript_35802/g.47267 Transcript_35802/m.47267 type:complete len:374 (+) Transcript_35802:60-1181(+)